LFPISGVQTFICFFDAEDALPIEETEKEASKYQV